MAVVAVAPCQCFSLGANQTTSPGRISSTGPASRWSQPQPDVTISVCPSGCVCHAVRAPGSKVTLAPAARGRSGRAEQWIDAHRAGEPLRGSFAGRLGSDSFDFHRRSPLGAALPVAWL